MINSTKKILLTGASGLLGANISALLPSSWQLVGVTLNHPLVSAAPRMVFVSVDLSDPEAVATLDAYGPYDAIVHTAALTNVDLCEQDRALADRLIVRVSQTVADYAEARSLPVVAISTDHLFSGLTGNYTEQAEPAPINYYAHTKYQAENIFHKITVPVTIIRTNFFGWNAQPKIDLAGWIVQSLMRQEKINLFTDVYFSPILVTELVKNIFNIIDRRLTGLINVAGANGCSKYEFGMMLARQFGLDSGCITPISVDQSHLTVPRPKNMTLDTSYGREELQLYMPTVAESVAEYYDISLTEYPDRLKKLVALK